MSEEKSEVEEIEDDLGLELLGELDNDSDGELIPVETDEEPEDEVVATDEEETTDDDEPGEETPDLEAQLESANKRVKDNQASYQKEHQENLRLQEELERLRANDAEPEPATGDGEFDEDAFYDDPAAAIKAMREERKRDIAQLRDEQSQRQLEVAEAEARKGHEDYDSVINDFLVPKMKEDPVVLQKWVDNGRSPEFAYQMGKEMMEFEAYQKDPEGFRDRLREELKQEASGNKPKIGKTLSSTTSARGKVSKQESEDLLDVLN